VLNELRRCARRRRHRRHQRRLALPKVLRAFADEHPAARFVEVGSNDGEQHDHLREFILDRGWTGVMVEPVPYVFARLQANYAGVDGVRLENSAIAAQAGRMTFHHLRDASPEERATLPDWYDGVGSFDRATILSHAPQMPDIAERIVEREVEALTFAGLCERHGIGRLDVLVIDTEGYDAEILRHVDLAAHAPRLVVYEHYHLSRADRAATRALLERAGYETMEEGFDTIALRPDDDAVTRRFRSLEPAIPGLSKEDEA
jgi:FkbM family methyltransferase